MAGLQLQSVSVSSTTSELPVATTSTNKMPYVLWFSSSVLVEVSYRAEGESNRGLSLQRWTFLGLQELKTESKIEVSTQGKYLLSSRWAIFFRTSVLWSRWSLPSPVILADTMCIYPILLPVSPIFLIRAGEPFTLVKDNLWRNACEPKDYVNNFL